MVEAEQLTDVNTGKAGAPNGKRSGRMSAIVLENIVAVSMGASSMVHALATNVSKALACNNSILNKQSKANSFDPIQSEL